MTRPHRHFSVGQPVTALLFTPHAPTSNNTLIAVCRWVVNGYGADVVVQRC
jgi:hypothetical protein